MPEPTPSQLNRIRGELREQFQNPFRIARLRKKVIEARLLGNHAIGRFHILAGNSDQQRARSVRHLANRPRHFPAIGRRHPEIEHYRVWLEPFDGFKCLAAAVRAAHLIALVIQDECQGQHRIRIIIRYDDAYGSLGCQYFPHKKIA